MAHKRKEEDDGRRRKPGSGYATQAPNGTWIGHFPKQPRGYHVRRGFDTRQAAEDWCDSLVKRQQAKEDIGKGQQRVDAWLDAWKFRETREREWKAKSVADVEWKLGYVKPHIGSAALADVMPDHIDDMLDTLGQSLAQSTVRQIRNYLYQAFEAARDRRYITFNPVIKPSRRKRPRQKPPTRLSAPQAALLIVKATDSFYALAWWLALSLGLRAGEVCGLRWGDLDLEHAIVHIEQEVTDVRGKATKDKPKNDKLRHLPLPRALVDRLEAHRKAYLKRAAQGLQKGYWQEHGLVFPGRGGRPMNPTSLRHQLKVLTDACKLPPVTTHMLRHTAAKFYTDQHTEHKIMQALLGHTPDITGHYGPPDPDAMRPDVERVYRTLAGEVERAEKKASEG